MKVSVRYKGNPDDKIERALHDASGSHADARHVAAESDGDKLAGVYTVHKFMVDSKEAAESLEKKFKRLIKSLPAELSIKILD